MSISKLGILILSTAALAGACSSRALSPAPRDSSTSDLAPRDSGTNDAAVPPTPQVDSGVDARSDAAPPPACGAAPPDGAVPSFHRTVATTCSASSTFFLSVDPTRISCTTTADCRGDGGSLNWTCLNGHCSVDQCLTDADCGPTGACACARSTIQFNVCVPASCHVDSDCGPGGYCSSSVGCGLTGVYCNTPNDTCLDATRDCASCGLAKPSCIYAPETGTFVCGDMTCTSAG
jgi:hypothetical protein